MQFQHVTITEPVVLMQSKNSEKENDIEIEVKN